jgi:hypothetical protein
MREVEKKDGEDPKPHPPDGVSGGFNPLLDGCIPDPSPYPVDYPGYPGVPVDPLTGQPLK